MDKRNIAIGPATMWKRDGNIALYGDEDAFGFQVIGLPSNVDAQIWNDTRRWCFWIDGLLDKHEGEGYATREAALEAVREAVAD